MSAGDPFTEMSDVYSFGVVMWEVCSCRFWRCSFAVLFDWIHGTDWMACCSEDDAPLDRRVFRIFWSLPGYRASSFCQCGARHEGGKGASLLEAGL